MRDAPCWVVKKRALWMIDLRPERRGSKKVGITEENPRLLHILYQSGWFFKQSKFLVYHKIEGIWSNMDDSTYRKMNVVHLWSGQFPADQDFIRTEPSTKISEDLPILLLFCSTCSNKWITYSDLRFFFSVLFRIRYPGRFQNILWNKMWVY